MILCLGGTGKREFAVRIKVAYRATIVSPPKVAGAGCGSVALTRQARSPSNRRALCRPEPGCQDHSDFTGAEVN